MQVAIAGSVTGLDGNSVGKHAIVGSHGGSFTAEVALRIGVASLICHDAGVGLQDAGIKGLALLDEQSVPAAATDYRSARIGDADDMLSRGTISHVNAAAGELGIRKGQAVHDAAAQLQSAPSAAGNRSKAGRAAATEHRAVLRRSGDNRPSLVLVDSASLIQTGDKCAIVVTGSHGGLPGGDRRAAVKTDVLCAMFNDAGVGIDNAGIGRLAVLDERGIAAVAVDTWSARIGNAHSSYETGILSHANRTAARLGAAPGVPVRELVARIFDDSSRNAHSNG